MSPTPTLALVPDTSGLEQRIALIACGVKAGKTQACDMHRGKGAAFLDIASTGAVDALAAAICGTGRGPACTRCEAKAQEIIRVYNEGAE
ncbi:hypothetical protein [Streptomyces cahuitamycinicus]|uniref:Uncharacterized protein n=1 Tax=Streptomyces cahuitamycinicus TaxID=2070367 RepID=A0A2N8TTM7_9ACTN|nr:hypothetical protein [Streptomyces cahuitamycinicus]PNG22350.1 hypothetical protein C1J00_10060 [Streptomyces cahuitamycinicus]